MKNKTIQKRSSTREMVLTALFVAIILIMAFTPLGLIDLPLIKATILHVPVIIGGILLGPRAGGFFGLIFALTSLFKNTTAPALLSFAFSPLIPVPGAGKGSLWALIICFVPRILCGIVPYYMYKALHRLFRRNENTASRMLPLIVAGAVGAIINTALVMGMIRLVLADGFASAKDIPLSAVSSGIMAIVLANGVPEMIASAVLTPAVCLPIMKIFHLDHHKAKAVSAKAEPSAQACTQENTPDNAEMEMSAEPQD